MCVFRPPFIVHSLSCTTTPPSFNIRPSRDILAYIQPLRTTMDNFLSLSFNLFFSFYLSLNLNLLFLSFYLSLYSSGHASSVRCFLVSFVLRPRSLGPLPWSPGQCAHCPLSYIYYILYLDLCRYILDV